MPAWIPWRKHWILYLNGKIDEGYMERKDSADREGLRDFLYAIPKICKYIFGE